MVVTEHLWWLLKSLSLLEAHSQRECQRFSLSFQHTALLHITPVNADIVQQEQYYYSQYIIVGCCPWSAILIVYSVNSVKLHFVNDFTGCEIMRDCMVSIPIHCPLKAPLVHLTLIDL